MEDLIKVDTELIEQETEEVEVFDAKILNIRSSTPHVDFRGAINKVLQYVDAASVLNSVKKGAEYVVQIPAELQGGFESGRYWIMENGKTGKMWPTLIELGEDGKNKIVTPLAIKKKEFIQDNPVRDITNNYQNLYLQQQINELSSLIEDTLQVVQKIEHGQVDDRIRLLEAGRQGVMLALTQKDETSRTTAMLNAMNNINIAQNQIFTTFERRISEFEPLPKTAFVQFLKEMTSSGYLNKKDNEYDEIVEYYSLYLEATRMLAGSYLIMGDTANAQKVFDISIDKVGSIDYSRLKTIEYSHKDGEIEKIYENAIQYLSTEKQICIEDGTTYDCLEIAISGEEFMEVIEDGTKIPSKETE